MTPGFIIFWIFVESSLHYYSALTKLLMIQCVPEKEMTRLIGVSQLLIKAYDFMGIFGCIIVYELNHIMIPGIGRQQFFNLFA